MALFQRKPPAMVGVDISSNTIKLLEISCMEGKYRVESYAQEPLPEGAIKDQEIKDMDALGHALARAVKRSRTRAKHAAVAVSGSSVIIKTLHVNAGLSERDLDGQIQLEAERNIPYPLSEVNIDYQVLGISEDDPNLMDVMLCASRTENVDMLSEILHLGGLKAKVVDVQSYAAARAFQLLIQDTLSELENKVIAIVDIGATTTSFNGIYNGRTIYMRDQLFGGQQLTEEIHRRYGLTLEEAALAKKQGGLPDDYVEVVLAPFKDSVAQQIQRAIQFFISSTQYSEVDYILLAGGSALLKGLAESVQEKLSVHCSVANPFLNMSISPKVSVATIREDGPSLMVGCGLALRSFIHEHQS